MYATGLLAIGLTVSDACAEAVRNGIAIELAKARPLVPSKVNAAGCECLLRNVSDHCSTQLHMLSVSAITLG